MTKGIAREVGLLRDVAGNLASMAAPPGPVTPEFLRVEDFALVRRVTDRLLAVRRAGYEAFKGLTDTLVDAIPGIDRGIVFSNFEAAVLEFLVANYLSRPTAQIGPVDGSSLRDHFIAWFQERAKPRRVFVPCVISPWAAPPFSIGPVEFVFADEVPRSALVPQGCAANALSLGAFDRMLRSMKAAHANWLARVPVEGCEQERAEELGALAVDLAIVALQLAAPALGTRTMGRLDAHRGTKEQVRISEAGGYYNEGWSRRDPGVAIGTGTLADILQKTQPLIAAVGNRVQSFASGRAHLPDLETAWCDAAYWLHEALAEPIDSIAVAKLETALEVLLVAESTAGSKQRILKILKSFYGLERHDPINKDVATTAERFSQGLARDRSRILHGTWSTLNTRLTVDRGGLETFVTDVIGRAVIELDAYARSPNAVDSVDSFLAWVPRHSP